MRNKYINLKSRNGLSPGDILPGRRSTETMVYRRRLFVDDKEVLNSPVQKFGNKLPRGGDIKYRI
ncbi:hypothetical protein CS542_02010 [Pedobacter sp. IW39]|nr:hypothetical protein CS542_02010 [Pedobacter sp. IW39]